MMDFSNEGQSFFHRFQGASLHDENRQLLHCTGPHRNWLYENWASVDPEGHSQELLLHDTNVKVYRKSLAANGNTMAVMVSNDPTQAERGEETAFEEFFVQSILDQADLCAHSRPSTQTVESDAATEKIVDLFDSYLRYRGNGDKWDQGGRVYFADRVRHFTAQNAPVQFCLPAFPCKSSNHDKVTGPDPDRGEELALERLHGFVEAIEAIYEPGAKLWIISDGHVFSDCIGVDDADVDLYGEKLKQMNRAIGRRRGNPGRVVFKSLVDMFQLAVVESSEGLSELANRLKIPTIDHHVDTQVTEEAELCRRILMAGCSPQKSAVRAKIHSKDAAITALYRGFSRFMLEDLEYHPHAQKMTRSQQKKLSSKVAFEMILRNQAYSNLVELLFPNHVRLSIHAHNNAGPKFGIQLFDPVRVRAVRALSPDGELMTSLDLLHIPTPWHNSVVQLSGSDVILVAKAKDARAALATGSMRGGLVKSEGGRAFFQLERRVVPAPTSEREAEPEPVELEQEQEATLEGKAKDTEVTVTVTVTVLEKDQEQKRATFTLSEKADAVVTAVVRRTNTGAYSVAAPELRRHDTWLGRLRWLLSMFWPKRV